MKGMVALITGGASGLGSTISEVLASKGCNIIINYNTSYEKAIILGAKLEEKYHIKVLTIKCDYQVKMKLIIW